MENSLRVGRRIALVSALLSTSAAATTPTLTDAIRIQQQLTTAQASHATTEERDALRAAALLPWPMLDSATDQLVTTRRAELDAETRRAWALDRALPMLAGELNASQTVLDDVLAEVGAAAHVDAHRPGEMVQMDEARKAYAHRQLVRAEERYSSVVQGSSLWPDALRERAWTLLLLARPNDALGATVALGAPYFPQEDHAEGRLLHATVLLTKCRFDEARTIIAPLADAQLPELDPDAALEALRSGKVPDGGIAARAWQSPLVVRVRVALSNPADDGRVEQRREVLIHLGARLFRTAFFTEADALRQLKQRALAVRYEAFRHQRGLVEAGSQLSAPVPIKPEPLDDEEVAWSFDGTYWRDELGSYRYSAGDACPRGAGR